MKYLKKYTYLLIFLFIATLFACEDMMSFHQKYIEGGEIVYLVKTDSVKAFSGRNRVLIKCLLKNAYNVDKIWVYWNEGNDSLSFDYTMKSELDSVDLLITGLEEKSYIFDIFTKNSKGKRSVKVTTFASVYGDRYIGTLSPRMISSLSYDTSKVVLNWLSSEESERITQVKYTKNSGNDTIVEILPKISKDTLLGFAEGSTIKYRSYFKPNAAVIDSFESAWNTFNYTPAYEVYKTLKVAPITGGVSVSWDNPLAITVKIKVEYKSNAGVNTSVSNKLVPFSINNLNTNLREFKITLTDISGNSFGPKVFKAAAL